MNNQMQKNSGKYVKVELAPNCFLVKSQVDGEQDFTEDIAYGLSRKDKFIPSKYFYDDKGSALFDRICDLPEYYPTKKELEILSSVRGDLGQYLDGNYIVVELGSGSAVKTRHIFDALSNQEKIEYYPIDISDIVKESSERLQSEFDNLHITGIVDQYEKGLDYIKNINKKKIIAFFGSSLGNFDQKGALEFLKKINGAMNESDLFLLGVDLEKDTKVLESAYNDSEGVTREFNLNLLSRINNSLKGDFNLESFEHVAFYNSKEKRIEMHLESNKEQKINISALDMEIKMKKGERIRTEYSYKYTHEQIKQLAKDSQFNIRRVWTDRKDYFALVLFSKLGERQT